MHSPFPLGQPTIRQVPSDMRPKAPGEVIGMTIASQQKNGCLRGRIAKIGNASSVEDKDWLHQGHSAFSTRE